MKRKLTLWIIYAMIAIAVIITLPQIVHSQDMIAQGMMGRGMMGGDGRIIHQLFANHHLIDRKIEEIPGGISAVTTSKNPQIAALIKTHVQKMYQRIENHQVIPMMMMSSTVPTMAENAENYDRKWEITAQGIVVTETSNDPNMVKIIRDHAQEINEFIRQGTANMGGMMNN
jgi:hypothetical protein